MNRLDLHIFHCVSRLPFNFYRFGAFPRNKSLCSATFFSSNGTRSLELFHISSALFTLISYTFTVLQLVWSSRTGISAVYSLSWNTLDHVFHTALSAAKLFLCSTINHFSSYPETRAANDSVFFALPISTWIKPSYDRLLIILAQDESNMATVLLRE